MKNLLVFFGLIVLVCYSCDGRKTKKEALQNAVVSYNQKQQPREIIVFSPPHHVEVVTDTLIEQTTRVHIKNHSIPNQHILISQTKKGAKTETHYQRLFECEISISIASRDILKTHISADNFKEVDNDPFWKSTTLQHAWVNQEKSSKTQITLDFVFINPKLKQHRLYRMSVSAEGEQTTGLVEKYNALI